jgi:hypothetical protein
MSIDNVKAINDAEDNITAKGKILRVKEGYNPNSSSMGSIVFALPAGLLGVTAAFGLAAGAISTAFMSEKSKKTANSASEEIAKNAAAGTDEPKSKEDQPAKGE